jgi:lysophospholipase L1-like esterase
VPYAANAGTYRVTSVTGLANTTHSVVLTGTTGGSVYVMGIRYKTGTGAMVGRFGRPGWTSNDLLGKGVLNSVSAAGQIRLLKSFGMGSPALTVLSIGHNDCANQLTQSTTVANYKTNLQNIADEVTADGGCMLLLSQPLPPYASPGSDLYPDYWQAADEVALAKTHVAHVNINDLSEWKGATNPIASGLQNSGSVHPTIAGYANLANHLPAII